MPAQPILPPPPGPPLLLTKRLIAFLHSTLTPTLTTCFLATPSGKLLAHASSDPSATVASLRTRATVAALLWDIHAASSVAAADATAEGSSRRRASVGATAKKPSTITVQLEKAVVVIRRLVCGIFYVAMGPIDGPPPAPGVGGTANPAAGTGPAHKEGGGLGAGGQEMGTSPLDTQPHPQQQEEEGQEVPTATLATSVSPPPAPAILEPSLSSSSTPRTHAHQHPHTHGHTGFSPAGVGGEGGTGNHLAVGSPSESVISAGASSIASVGAQGAVTLRRQAEEVAQRLDVKLGTLRVPGERIGVEFTQQ